MVSRKLRQELGLTEEDRKLREECERKARRQSREAWNLLADARKATIRLRDAREDDRYGDALEKIFTGRRRA
jgi:hypothetical protein